MFFAGTATLTFLHNSLRLAILGQPRTISGLLDGSYISLLFFVIFGIAWMAEDRR